MAEYFRQVPGQYLALYPSAPRRRHGRTPSSTSAREGGVGTTQYARSDAQIGENNRLRSGPGAVTHTIVLVLWRYVTIGQLQLESLLPPQWWGCKCAGAAALPAGIVRRRRARRRCQGRVRHALHMRAHMYMQCT